ncbi:MAG TPA: prephenate dehydrogenase/arogenate dehydrogenase family protein [Candidatus Sulfotelmatobacter sp.]|jgi:prephenate dehydrogenase|nr:prephenate dehydrogenase/arogenate dehydrogenase family protein [Candidatus Sulfotelmatobacter sp.]
MRKKTVTIIGFGRFGKTLYELLKNDFDITIYQRHSKNQTNKNVTNDLKKAYKSEVIFYAVPIQTFSSVITEHKQFFRSDHLLIDVLSVKLHPKKILREHLKGTKTQALLTHPLFGPDSSKNGFTGLPIVMDKFLTTNETYLFWKNYFNEKNLRIIELTADKHDKLAANSQGLTHFIGRLLQEFAIEKTTIDTIGTTKLLEVKEQTCNDTWELFINLQQYNPYTKEMRITLGDAYNKLYNKLIPKQINKKYVIIGIQGGIGSFNEEAVQHYLQRNAISHYKIAYLHTSKNVLLALHEGTIDQGIFAIHNSAGGIVMESVEAMAQYKFSIIEEFAIKISHALLIKKDTKLSNITTIMTHPQVLSQCKNTLENKYQNLKQISGEGEMIDHALVAKQLSKGKLPNNIATMGSKILAELYDLTIVEDNLQDLKENYTSFLLVGR